MLRPLVGKKPVNDVTPLKLIDGSSTMALQAANMFVAAVILVVLVSAGAAAKELHPLNILVAVVADVISYAGAYLNAKQLWNIEV